MDGSGEVGKSAHCRVAGLTTMSHTKSRPLQWILDFQNGRVRFFQEVEGATGDSTRCRRACEEICQPLDEVEVDAVEGVEAEREEMGAQEEAAGREAAQDIGEHVVR